MVPVISAVDQRYSVPLEELRDTESFSQTSVLPPAIITGAGGTGWMTASVAAEDGLRQVVASVMLTVKLPADFTRMV